MTCWISSGVMLCVNVDWFILCFFFQAEDGIRDLVRSRGLGDVYKRQRVDVPLNKKGADILFITPSADYFADPGTYTCMGSVSYTHLTLPTIYSV